jgi:hypothetical protein
MASVLQIGLHAVQVAVSASNLYHAYISITNLRKYEEQMERAAKYVDEAAYRLRKTRTTQAAGTLALLSSCIVAFYLMMQPNPPTAMKFFYNAVNVIITMAAKAHVDGFWSDKRRVPFVTGYNEGIRRTNTWSQNLGLVTAIWLLSTLVEMLRLAL